MQQTNLDKISMMMIWALVRIWLLVGVLWYTEALVCTIGQERDPGFGFRYRWVIPEPDPCQCTSLRVGGLDTITPYRPFVVTYMDTFIYSDDQEEIRTWLNCTNPLLKHLILNKSFAHNGSHGLCEGTTANSTEYTIRGDPSLVKMVPGPDVAGQACTVYTKAGSYLDLGDFKDTCISDPGLCESMTWSLWLKIDPSTGFTRDLYYISSGGQTRLARGIALMYKKLAHTYYMYYIVQTVRSSLANKYHPSKIPLDKWFHVALTIELNQKVVKDMKFYIDGELQLADGVVQLVGGWREHCTELYLGMPNTCKKIHSSDTWSGSAAYSNLMVFDRLLNQEEIKNLIK